MAVSKLILINADGPETRVALVEGGLLAELHIERRRERGLVGNVYKGRVARVLPGMQAAFIDIGLEKHAYLSVSDARGTPEDVAALFVDEDEGRRRGRERDDEDEDKPRGRGASIQEVVREGQDLLVQVTKEPIGTKGARVTTYLSLPGRHLVFMPTVDHVGISRRVRDDRERKRLRDIVQEKRPPGTGFVVRTVAEGVPAEVLRDDMEYLIRLWNEKIAKAERSKAPACLYWDLDLVLRTVRDLLTPDVEKVIIDSASEHERLRKFVATFMPHFSFRLELHGESEQIFDAYGIETEIGRALERKVWLHSGGYLLVDQLEALSAIDVNTGKFVGRRNLEDTITKTNLEAVREIVAQIRLRNMGGILVLDFIDMDKQSNREKVSRALQEALKSDRARTNVLKISELGLVEMTRKRTRESLGQQLTDPCPYCEGKGTVRSRMTIAYDALREVRRRGDVIDGTIVVRAHPDVAAILTEEERDYVDHLQKRFAKTIEIRADDKLHLERFEVVEG